MAVYGHDHDGYLPTHAWPLANGKVGITTSFGNGIGPYGLGLLINPPFGYGKDNYFSSRNVLFCPSTSIMYCDRMAGSSLPYSKNPYLPTTTFIVSAGLDARNPGQNPDYGELLQDRYRYDVSNENAVVLMDQGYMFPYNFSYPFLHDDDWHMAHMDTHANWVPLKEIEPHFNIGVQYFRQLLPLWDNFQ